MVLPCSDRISRVPPYSRLNLLNTHTGLSPTMVQLSRWFCLDQIKYWPGPRSLATTRGISVDVFSSGYLDVSVRRVRLTNLCIQLVIPQKWWVSPFGYLRVKGYWHLAIAFRSLSRPSSPPYAKASTKCPYDT